MSLKNPINALHALLASSGVGAIADALVKLHGAAQAGGFGVGIAALASAALSAAWHSRKVAEFAHAVAADESKIVTPGVVARVQALEATAAKFIPVEDAKKMVEDAVAKVEAEIPAPAKVAVEDVRPLVDEILAPLAALLPKPAAPAEPVPASAADPAAPAAPPAGTTEQAA